MNFLKQAPYHHSPPQSPSCLPFALRLGLRVYETPWDLVPAYFASLVSAAIPLHFTQSFHFLEGSIVSVSCRPLCAVPSSILHTLPSFQEHSHLHASLKLPAKLEGWMRSPCPYCTGHVPLTAGHCPGTRLCALMGSVGWGHMHLILSYISSTWQVLNMCLLYERLAGGPDHKEFGLLPGGIRHHRGF